MSVGKPFSVSVFIHPQHVTGLAAVLKRLALLSDDIAVFVAQVGTIPSSVLNDPKKVMKISDREWNFANLDLLRDTGWLSMTLGTLATEADPETRDVIQALENAGFLRKLQPGEAMTEDQRKAMAEVTRLLMEHDVKSVEFNALTGTTPEDYKEFKNLSFLTVKTGAGATDRFAVFDRPRALSASYDISSFLITSESRGFSPILLHPGDREVIKFRYRQFQREATKLPVDLKAELGFSKPFSRLGEAVFLLSDSLFAPEALARKPITDILKYREAMSDARHRFLSVHFAELVQLVETEPWDEASEGRVDSFIRGNLQPGIRHYQDEAERIHEKLLGDLAVDATSAARSAVTIGFGSLLAQVAIHTTHVGMLAVSALAWAVKAGPDVTRTLVDYARAAREHKRNSLAYIAEFT